jgi:putative FmdB family regulatory protein
LPTYQYACTACDHRFEAVQSFSDASLSQCPECGGALRKVFSSVGVVFKGSGFYQTDNRDKATAGVGASTAGTDSTKSDTTSTTAPASEASTRATPAATTKAVEKSAPASTAGA